MFPVAHRELLVAARRRSTIWVRFASGTICLLLWLFLLIWVTQSTSPSGLNGFYAVSFLAFSFCVLAGFFFTADSVSSERREGTLPLLFHSRTNVADIVLGKFLGVSLVPVYGLIAILPFFALSILDGGVRLSDVAIMAVALVVTLLFSLASGLLASILARDDDAAYIQTAIILIAPAVPCGLGIAAVFIWNSIVHPRTTRWFLAGLAALAISFASAAIWLSSDWFIVAPYQPWAGAFARARNGFWIGLVYLALSAVLYLLAASALLQPSHYSHAALRGSKQRDASSQLRRSRSASAPMGVFFRYYARGAINLVLLATVLEVLTGAVTLWSAATQNNPGITFLTGWTVLLHLFLTFAAARLAIVICAALHQSGTLEVLLSTPLRLRDIIRAAQKVFWTTTVPLIAVVATVHLAQALIFARQGPTTIWRGLFLSSLLGVALYIPYYAAIFWLGNYFFLRLQKPGSVLFLTLAAVFLIPSVASYLFQFFAIRHLLPYFEGIGLPVDIPYLVMSIAPSFLTAGILITMIFFARSKVRQFDRTNAWLLPR